MTHIDGIATVAIPVSDQQAAVDFYVTTLGFEVRRDMPFGTGRWIEVAPPGCPTTISLVGAGVPLGVRFTTTDADASHASLEASGADVDASVMRIGNGVPPMFTGRDPDGNTYVVVGPA